MSRGATGKNGVNARPRAVMAVYLLLEREGKVLLLLRQNTGYHDGDWSMPSGHVETGELITEAMIREAEEEVGIRLQKEDLEFKHAMFRGTHDATGERADYFFAAKNWEGEPENREPHKCVEIRWFPKNELPANIIPHIKLALKSIERGIAFSEYPAGYFLRPHE